MFRTPKTSVGGNGGRIPITATTSAQSQNPSDMGDRSHHRSAASRTSQFHLARPAIIDLFNLYLGINGLHKSDDSIREPPNKTQKRVTALHVDIPPRNEQFLPDFEQLQNQFPDHEQLHTVVKSVLVSLVIQCGNHEPRSAFILFALHSLYSIGYIYWDSFLPSLLSSVTSAEMSFATSAVGPNSSHIQSPNPEFSSVSVHGIGSPFQSSNQQAYTVISSLRKLCCQIIISAIEANLNPSTYADIFHHVLSWLINWDPCQQGSDEVKSYKRDKVWLGKCLRVVRMLFIEDNKCRVPFYELLRSGLHFLENLPDDLALFTLVFEVHRRRDMMAMHMQMLDEHLHCPTFGNQRLLNQISILGESANLKYSPITYPSVLGEPLHGEVIAFSIQRGSVDWERALRCISHAIRNTPSPDWWRRVLMVAPCHGANSQGPTSGAVFTCDMICEATIGRILELLELTNSDVDCWQDWVIFSDVLHSLMRSCCMDFVDFLDKLVLCLADDHQIVRTNHVTWLLVQIIRTELVVSALNADSRKAETTKKLVSFHKEARSTDPNNPQSILLDFICSSHCLRIWSLSSSTREYLNNEQLLKGKQIDEWWRQVSKGEYMMDYMNLDDSSIGMLWVVSYTMPQPACEMVMTWLTCDGYTESNLQANGTITVRREVNPVPISLLSGFSINLCLKLAFQMENNMFTGVHAPNIAMVETYTRLMLIHPYSLFRSLLSHLHQKNPETFNKPGATLLALEILNYRLFSLYRYQGKNKTLMYDVTKILSTLKVKRGEHRIVRLAENLCLNLIMSLREFFYVSKDGKGPAEFTETLNRVTVMSLAIIIKTRGISDAAHRVYLQTMLEQILATSTHTWSDKTLFYFPPVLRNALIGRVNKRALAIQAWQHAEETVIHQCTQLLSPPDDPTYVMTYISHSFPEHRKYLCAGAWVLMRGHPEDINTGNLGRVLREFSPEEVTSNVYTLVDVLLHNIQLELQHGHSVQDVLSKTCENIAQFIWIHELLPPDILLLALIDRDDDLHALHIVVNLLERQELQQRIKSYTANQGNPEHWLQNGVFKRVDLQKALGNHLSWKEKYPTYFDDIAARLLPVIPLIIYRLIENNATDAADRVLQTFSSFLHYYSLNFTFVRDILAYFYGHLPGKLIYRILNVLDIKKIPFSESFAQFVNSPNAISPPLEYYASLISGLVNYVIPPLCNSKGKGSIHNDLTTNHSGLGNAFKVKKSFYEIQDPGTYTQLILETAVIEILSLPVTASQIVSTFVQIIVTIRPTFIHSNLSFHGSSSCSGSGSTDSLGGCGSNPLTSQAGPNKQFSCVMIQACGLLFAQLPIEFHVLLYEEASRVIKDNARHSAVGYALLDPTWAAQNNTSTALGNMVSLLHAFFSNLPQEWLDKTHLLATQLRPISSVALLRIAFRIFGPLLPRVANAHTLFMKTLELLLSMMADVFGKNSQTLAAVEASEITDLVDFLYHVVHYEGEGGPVQPNSKPRPDVLALCGRAIENLRPDVQCLLIHLKPDINCSIYAAATQDPP